jgi:hypothetical protein
MTRFLVLCLGACLLIGCASEPAAPTGPSDPLQDIFSKNRTVEQRTEAVDRAWDDALAGRTERAHTIEQFKKALFLPAVPDPVRVRVCEKLLSDTDPAAAPDIRNTMRLRLPRETNWVIIGMICDAAAERGWTDLTPSLIRSWARKTPDPDDKRPERAALMKLYPGRSMVEVVYETFMSYRPRDGVGNILDERVWTDAWDLLSRLDVDGSVRARLLAADHAGPAQADGKPHAMVEDLRAGARDLRIVPLTGSELEWVRSLRAPGNPAAAAWWSQASAAVRRLSAEQAAGLQLRNIEPIRWASVNRAELVSLDRAALRSQLAERLAGRKIHVRSIEGGAGESPEMESLEHWDSKLSWGDLLSIVVIDEAIRDRAVVPALFDQADEDRADRRTEYGGAMEAVAAPGDSGGEAFVATGYLPTSLGGDLRFVASDQMVAATPRSLAYYHFHVQEVTNSRHAGPGSGDLEYAATSGRNCVVFTSITKEILAADYYQRGGARIDLGEIRR